MLGVCRVRLHRPSGTRPKEPKEQREVNVKSKINVKVKVNYRALSDANDSDGKTLSFGGLSLRSARAIPVGWCYLRPPGVGAGMPYRIGSIGHSASFDREREPSPTPNKCSPWQRGRSCANIIFVVEEGLLFGDRIWFFDTRAPARRMAVSAHPSEGVMVISLWQGDSCTGTFRLPMKEGARLVSTLAQGMAAGLPEPGDSPLNSDPTHRLSLWRRWLARLLDRSVKGQSGHLHVVR
jgi:hypothetical protein